MRVAVIHATATPHTSAQEQAGSQLFAARGGELLSIYVARGQSDYRWESHGDRSGSAWSICLFANADYWAITNRDMKAALVDALDDHSPDVVVVSGWSFPSSRAVLGWSIRNDRARVVISDTQRYDERGPRHRRPPRAIKKWVATSFDAAFVAGTRQVEYARSLGIPSQQIFVGCDVVDNRSFACPDRKPPGGPPKLLSCLRLLPVKNVDFVLDVLAAQESDWVWDIAGDGPSRAVLEGQASSLGLAQRVRFLGHIPHDELRALYCSADVYLQPSRSDSWGLAVNEAMAAGLPILVSDGCGCSPDLVRPGENGWTFDPKERDDLALALSTMGAARERWSEMGRASAEIIAAWDLDLYAENLVKACEAALEWRSQNPPGPRARVMGRLL